MTRQLAIAAILLCLVSCSHAPSSSAEAMRFPGLTGAHRDVGTTAEAQELFDQGLMWIYGFNHDEAVRSFEAAEVRDPSCAMALWGTAYALGPNINLPMTNPETVRRARVASERAFALSGHARPVDAALIAALRTRYDEGATQNRAALDARYADAMREVWKAYPDDPDVGALFADALLNLRPWDQWTKEGEPRPGTPEIVNTLERVLELHPDHVYGLHLYIHALEASPNPERALEAARRLDGLVPGAGHTQHMPSHIYVRLGRWWDSVQANQRGLVADRAYFRRAGPQGVYEYYKGHVHHFVTYSALFLGHRALALSAAREFLEECSPSAMEALPEFADCYLPQPLHVMVRFGRWEEILNEPEFGPQFPIARATRLYARGVALANLDRTEEAEVAYAELVAAANAMPEEARVVGTPARAVFEVAKPMLEGEIRFRQGRTEDAFAALRRAIAAEDALPYDEPRGWMQPVRHALAALLLQEGRIEESEVLYREDLLRNPNNGWALHGLAECLRRRGAADEASTVQRQFEEAWRHADGPITASCFCRRP